MEDVESELIVDAPHTTIHMISKTIFEVRRILLEHLHEVDSSDRLAKRSKNLIRPAVVKLNNQQEDANSRLPVVIKR